MVVPHGVPADSRNVLPQCSIDDRAGVRRGRPIAAYPGKTPYRSAVPEVLHGGIVVQGDAEREVLLEQLCGISVPDVGVIPGEMVALAGISHLHEAADMR